MSEFQALLLKELKGLPLRVKNRLFAEYGPEVSCEDIAKLSREDLLGIPNIGQRSVTQIMEVISIYKHPVLPEKMEILELQKKIEETKAIYRDEMRQLHWKLREIESAKRLEGWNEAHSQDAAFRDGCLVLNGKFSESDLVDLMHIVEFR